MRTLPVLLLCAGLLAGCKKEPKPTLPQLPDSDAVPSGGNIELPEATIFHSVYRYAGHAGQVAAFYASEMKRRGARKDGDGYTDDNLVHSGGFGRDGQASVKDPSRPGVWVYVLEQSNATLVDVWEAVPKPR
jgi:hypothetical protein